MVNKLRIGSAFGGGFLLLLSAWSFLAYGGGIDALWPFLKAGFVALLVVGIAPGIAHAKMWLERLRQAESRRGLDPRTAISRAIYLSDASVPDREAALATIREAAVADDTYDGVDVTDFAEGKGLSITHSGFHNLFVRVTDSGRLAVTGESERTRDIVSLVERVCPVTMTQARSNPFLQPKPIKGAPRTFLSLFLVALVVLGTMTVLGAAYPADAYNPAEKAVLVSVDLRTGFDPGMSDIERRLTKAAFMVEVLDEKSTEIRWVNESPDRVERFGRQALTVSEDVRALLATVQSSGTSDQRSRAEELEADLRRAERETASALDSAAQEAEPTDKRRLHELSDHLEDASNRSISS